MSVVLDYMHKIKNQVCCYSKARNKLSYDQCGEWHNTDPADE